MTKLDLTRPVQTRDGRPVRILCTDRRHPHYPVVGLLRNVESEFEETWTSDGRYNKVGRDSSLDLINVPPRRVKREGWINLYKAGPATYAESGLFLTKTSAVEAQRMGRAYIEPGRIEWEEDETP